MKVPKEEKEAEMSNELELKKIRQTLEERRAILLSRLQVKETQTSSQNVENADRSDLAQDYFSQDRNTALVEQMQQTLDQIDDALERLDEGTYGLCANCGNEISTQRLEVLPHAKLCIDCKKIFENR